MQHTPRRTSVLIIEDDSFYRTLYVNQLKKIGSDFRLVTSENGYSALMSIGQKSPDLIILDLCMPRFDGVSFLEVVKSNPAYKNLPILVISAEISMLPPGSPQYPNTYVFQKPIQAAVFERIVCLALHLPQQSGPGNEPTVENQGLVDHGHMNVYIGHDPAMHKTIAEQFVALAPERIARLAKLVRDCDFEEIRHFCHGMQSTAETIGAHDLARIVHELSIVAREYDHAGLAGLDMRFAQAMQDFCRDLVTAFELAPNP